MRKLATILAGGLLLAGTIPASAALACADLKARIAEGFDAKKVSGYTLTIVAADATADGKVVGTCDGGKNKIVYARGSEPPKGAPAATSAPTKSTAPPAKK